MLKAPLNFNQPTRVRSSLVKSFSFETTDGITSHVCFPIHCVYTSYLIRAIFTEVWEIERLQTSNMTFKLTVIGIVAIR